MELYRCICIICGVCNIYILWIRSILIVWSAITNHEYQQHDGTYHWQQTPKDIPTRAICIMKATYCYCQ